MARFVPRVRKHKVLARQNATSNTVNDSNQDIVLPTTKADKEVKRQELRAELRAQQSKISSKKQKRLDKYIETKLKKDETRDYLRRLESERDRFDVRDVSSKLSSSKDLNPKKRRFDDYVEGQIRTTKNDAVSNDTLEDKHTHAANEVDDDAASEDSFEADHQEAFDQEQPPTADEEWLAKRAPAVQGTGLAQPLQLGLDGLPVIQLRGKKKRRPDSESVKGESTLESQTQEAAEIPWDGFDSEDNAMVGQASADNGDVAWDKEDDQNSTQYESETISGEDSQDEEDSLNDESGSETSASDIFQPRSKLQPRASAFKEWAMQQLNQAVGHVPFYSTSDTKGTSTVMAVPQEQAKIKVPPEPPRLVNGLPEVSKPGTNRAIHSVHVERAEAIQQTRIQLPILQREQEIMEAVHNNLVVVIKGATGSGKTTQLPQFLYEAGYGDPTSSTPGLIGITQPRRVAAVSMAKRVGEELGSHGNRVAHQIRFDSTVSPQTAIKFMTDGILLRELSQDLLLKKYSAIIIDEAHERSVNTDILIGMLSKIVPARMRKDNFNPDPKPLKLIIMSATLNIGDFLNDRLFPPNAKPPVVEAEGRQHRVTTHFALKSRADYLEETIEKVKRAHKKLPKGGILVFLTGKSEIQQAQRQLAADIANTNGWSKFNGAQSRMHFAATESPLEAEDLDFGIDAETRNDTVDEVDILTQVEAEASEDEFDISDDDNDDDEENDITTQSQVQISKKDPYDSVHILPLYSQLPTKEQLQVFEEPPERSRLIVLATNVAETSLTIPGIRYVFDCGRSKERKHDLETGVQSFEIDYISKASAQQRAGRAGRTGPGHCWRLYTSALFEQYFPDHAEPEIVRSPAESVVLQVKGFNYPKPVANFPFPTSPASLTLDKAERVLRNLGALSSAGKITELGKRLSFYPLSPRLAKILVTAVNEEGILAQVIALVAGLSVSDIFVNDAHLEVAEEAEDERNSQKQEFGRARATLSRHDKTSDGIRLMTAVTMYAAATDKDIFCEQHFLKPKPMSEVSQLVNQLRSIVQANHPGLLIPPLSEPKKMNANYVKLVNITAAAGYIDQIAVRWDCAPSPPALPTKPRRAIDVPYLPLVPLKLGVSADFFEKAVFIHPNSVLSRLSIKELPQYIVYTHLQQAQAHTITGSAIPKTRMFPLTAIDASSLARLARDTALLEYGKPIPKTKLEDLPGLPKRRICWVTTELKSGTTGNFGWNLPPSRVQQVMDVKSPSGWRVEEVLA